MNRVFIAAFAVLCASELRAAHFRHYKDLSDDEVTTRAEDLDPNAILELGHRDKTEAAPKLKKWAAEERPSVAVLNAKAGKGRERSGAAQKSLEREYARASRAAKMALAKMGDESMVKPFLADLRAKGKESEEAISALGYIGNRKTAKHLAALLDDDRLPEYPRSGHEIGTAYSRLAELALEEMFPEVFEGFRRANPGKRFHFKDEWKKWWAKNKGQYSEEIK